MSMVYLDQWVWIDLLKSFKEVNGYSGYRDSYTKIEESSNFNKHKFPVSCCHLIETKKRAKKESRIELLEFMFKISKMNSIYGFNVWDLEVENAILSLLGKKTHNLKKIIFGKGITHIYGLNSSNSHLEKIAYMCSVAQEPFLNKNLLDREKKLVEDIEIHRELYEHPDKEIKKGIGKYEFYVTSILPRIKRVLPNLSLSPEEFKLFISKMNFSTKDSADNFLKSIPSAYVFHMMDYTRNIDKSREIKTNDIYDLHCLSMAIPYCDIVITERSWANILNQNKIGEMYDTIIISKIEELNILL